jgi:vacuolar-type H+-ATPase subunit C/Vma6
MPVSEIALVARARGLAGHCLSRETLERLAEADDLSALVRSLARLGAALDPIGAPVDVFAVERAIARTANRYLRTMYRWQERTPGVLDVFAAHQDRRSLRAILRGAAQGKSSEARLEGLFPTPSLPSPALTALSLQASPADVVRRLVVLGHPDAVRLVPAVRTAHADLLGIDVALLAGFAARAAGAAAKADETVDEFVSTMIDVANAQNAIVIAGEPRDIDPAALFVHGGRWLSEPIFVSAARRSRQQALTTLATTLGHSALAPLLPVVSNDVVNLDRAFLTTMLERLTRSSRLDPLSYAPLLCVLLLIDAQSRDLRALVWGAVLGTPVPLRRQQLVTPS